MATAINKAYRNTRLWISDIDSSPVQSVEIQFVPEDLKYNPETRLVAIASMGRNAPIYHYTGAEDTLEFTLDWFAQELSRQDVIERCKFLEALSKNDNFDEGLHRVKLFWGHTPEGIEAEEQVDFSLDHMYNDARWIVAAAPYDLSLFHKVFGNLPQQAIQRVTLKRILENNSTREQIRRLDF